MSKLELTVDEAQDLLWGKFTKDVVLDEITDTSRWSEFHRLIFKKDGKFWETDYSCGLTELQDEVPWQYDNGPIICVQVEPYEKTITDYRVVDE